MSFRKAILAATWRIGQRCVRVNMGELDHGLGHGSKER